MRKDKTFMEALKKIREVFRKRNLKGTAYLFGSSIREDYLRTSDIDIAVDCLEEGVVTLLRSEMEELDIPYKIELIALFEASGELRKEILTRGVVLWKN
jgi:predicted nucleotidyltransferase